MNETITIMIVEPGKAPRPARVVNTLDNLQAIVGGKLEIACSLPEGSLLVFNKYGKDKGLQPNRRNPVTSDYIAGTFFLCGYKNGTFVSLATDQMEECAKWFETPGEFMIVGAETICTTPNELLLAAYRLWDDMHHGETILLTKWGEPENEMSV